MDQNIELRTRIIDAATAVFNDKGLKFTMDDIAKKLNISKKTIYTVFTDKESLFYAMVDYGFDTIKKSEEAVLMDPKLSTVDKIRKILGVLPESYLEIDFAKLYQLKEKYPVIYKHVEERLESGWEATIALIEKGMEEGVVRPVNVILVKTMLEATLEQFFQRDILVRNNITYQKALDDVVDILVNGIVR